MAIKFRSQENGLFADDKQKTALGYLLLLENLLEPISRYPRVGATIQTRRWTLTDWLSFQFDIRVVKSRAVLGTTEGGAQIILDVYRAPQRPSDAAMCGFSRRISQSGKSPRQLFLDLQMASLYLPE